MKAKQAYGLGLLFALNTINFLDRISVAAVVDELTKYFKLTSFEGGFLSSCFLFGYMLTAPVFGYLGDKYSRKWILIGGISFWCAAAFSGSIISPDYKALFFLSRALVGVGEASYSTIAPTIIADLFGPENRKLALSIFYFAIPIGSGLGFVVGNVALSLEDWRFIFWFTPGVGALCVCLLFLLEEPARGQSEGGRGLDKDDSTVIENIRYLLNIKSYIYMTLGFTCCLFATGALSWWAISFFKIAINEEYAKTATLLFGLVVAGAGFVGVSAGAMSAQYWRKTDERADPFVCAIGVFLAIPFTCFGLLAARSYTSLSWLLLFLSVTSLSTNWAVISDMTLSVTLPTKRAFATAIQILITHLFGDAASPFIVGLFNDELKKAGFDPYTSFLISLQTLLVPLFFGSIIFYFCAKYYPEDLRRCKDEIRDLKERSESGDDSTRRLESSNLRDFARNDEP